MISFTALDRKEEEEKKKEGKIHFIDTREKKRGKGEKRAHPVNTEVRKLPRQGGEKKRARILSSHRGGKGKRRSTRFSRRVQEGRGTMGVHDDAVFPGGERERKGSNGFITHSSAEGNDGRARIRKKKRGDRPGTQ